VPDTSSASVTSPSDDPGGRPSEALGSLIIIFVHYRRGGSANTAANNSFIDYL
jgi:hypothetical protein